MASDLLAPTSAETSGRSSDTPSKGPGKHLRMPRAVRVAATPFALAALLVGLASLAVAFGALSGTPASYGWSLQHSLLVLALLASALAHGVRAAPNWPVLALAAALPLSLVFGDLHAQLTPSYMLASLIALALPWSFAQVPFDPAVRRLCALAISLLPALSVIAGGLLQVVGDYPLFQGESLFHRAPYRLQGALGNPDGFAVLAFAGFAVALNESTRSGHRYAAYLAILNLMLVVLGGTRVGILACAVMVAAFALTCPPFRAQARRYLAVAVGAAVLTVIWHWTSLLTSVVDAATPLGAWSDLWSAYLKEFADSPMIGRGIGTGSAVASGFAPGGVHLHSTYLHVLASLGVLGSALLALGLIGWSRHLWQASSRGDRAFLLALAPALATFALTADVLLHPSGLALFVYLGILAAGARRRRRRTPDTAPAEAGSGVPEEAPWEPRPTPVPQSYISELATGALADRLRTMSGRSTSSPLLHADATVGARPGLEKLIAALVFVIPLIKHFEIQLVGRLFVSELVLIGLLPVVLLARGNRLFARLPLSIMVLGALWLFAQIVTDLIRETPVADYLRGWSKILFFVAEFATLYLLINGERRLILLFLAGLAGGEALQVALAGGATLAGGLPWKSGFAHPVTLAVLLVCTQIRSVAMSRTQPALAVAALGVLHIFLGYRSMGGICILTAAYLLLPFILGEATPNWRPLARQAMIFAALLIVAVGTLKGYGYAARAGWLGADARWKYNRQAAMGEMMVIVGGRSEMLVSMQAVRDSPIIGHGSWATDKQYARQRAVMLERLGVLPNYREPEVYKIPSHSHLMGAWVEAGIMGAVFWVYVLYLISRPMSQLYNSNDPFRPLLAYVLLQFVWDILFSPFGELRRMTDGMWIVMAIFAIQIVERRRARPGRTR